MDNSLKILIACLGIAGTLAMVVPSAVNITETDENVVKPIETSDIPPPSTPMPQPGVNGEQPTDPADREPAESDEDGIADFGKPMVDARPAGEQMSEENNNYGQVIGQYAQPGYAPIQGYPQPVQGYAPPGYAPPAGFAQPEQPSEPVE